jgi:hypothetical protein
MKSILSRSIQLILSGLLLMLVSTNVSGFEISITVAPNVLNFESEGHVVTVHTDIAYSSVDAHSVYLNGVLIQSWKADNRGNFVAKFAMEDIETAAGLVIGDYNELLLVGYSYDYGSFSGIDQVMVIAITPNGGKR